MSLHSERIFYHILQCKVMEQQKAQVKKAQIQLASKISVKTFKEQSCTLRKPIYKKV